MMPRSQDTMGEGDEALVHPRRQRGEQERRLRRRRHSSSSRSRRSTSCNRTLSTKESPSSRCNTSIEKPRSNQSSASSTTRSNRRRARGTASSNPKKRKEGYENGDLSMADIEQGVVSLKKSCKHQGKSDGDPANEKSSSKPGRHRSSSSKRYDSHNENHRSSEETSDDDPANKMSSEKYRRHRSSSRRYNADAESGRSSGHRSSDEQDSLAMEKKQTQRKKKKRASSRKSELLDQHVSFDALMTETFKGKDCLRPDADDDGPTATQDPSIAAAAEPPAFSRNDRLVRQTTPGAVFVPGNSTIISSLTGDDSVTTATTNPTATEDSAAISILNARVVDDDEEAAIPIGPFVEAKPLEPPKAEESPFKTLFKSRKVKLIIGFTTLLFLGLLLGIIAFVTTRGGPSASQPTVAPTGVTSHDLFVQHLKPLLTPSSVVALEIPDSHQALSLQWLLERSNFDAYTFDRRVQRYALATLYYATAGYMWNDKSGWLSEGDECTWFQDHGKMELCDEQGVLQVLSLQHNDLRGTLPDEFQLLSSLKVLNLGENELEGSILPYLATSFANLELLILSGNQFSGSIPSRLGQLSLLQELDLSSNFITGSIPRSIGDLTALQHLDFSQCLLTEMIPRTVDRLTILETFNAEHNFLRGNLPSEFGALLGLEELDISHNGLSGPIPSRLGQLDSLEWLSLANNTLSGSIPTQLGSLGALTALDLNHNFLSGSIPSEIGQCTSLQLLDLSSNGLGGMIPTQLGSLSNLEALHLYDNLLYGTMPNKVCFLTTSYTTSLSPDMLQVSCTHISCSCCSDNLGISCDFANPEHSADSVDV